MKNENLTWEGLFNLKGLKELYEKSPEKLKEQGVYLIGYSDEKKKYFPQYVGKSESDHGIYSRLVSHLMGLQAGYFLTYFADDKDYFKNYEPEERLSERNYFVHRVNNSFYGKKREVKAWKWNELKFLYDINFEPELKASYQKRISFIWDNLRVAFAPYKKSDIADVERYLIYQIHHVSHHYLQNQQIYKPSTTYNFKHSLDNILDSEDRSELKLILN